MTFIVIVKPNSISKENKEIKVKKKLRQESGFLRKRVYYMKVSDFLYQAKIIIKLNIKTVYT